MRDYQLLIQAGAWRKRQIKQEPSTRDTVDHRGVFSYIQLLQEYYYDHVQINKKSCKNFCKESFKFKAKYLIYQCYSGNFEQI